MYLRKYVIIVLLLFAFLQIRATGHSCDVIYINGEECCLMAKPIDTDSTLYARLRDFLPDNHCVSTANWNGYTAFWEVRNGYLYLRQMEICVYNETSEEDSTLIYDIGALRTLFLPYYEKEGICARWFSGELRVGQGDLIRYAHIGFDQNMENEQIMTIKHGKILKSRIYHNYKKAGFNFRDVQDEIANRFPWERFPEYEGQRLIFSIANPKITADGRLLDIDVHAIFIRPMREVIDDSDHPLAVAFKEILKNIYPWETYFINGRHMMEYDSFTILLRINPF